MNLAIWLARSARSFHDRPALFRGSRLVATYGEFGDRVARMAGALRDAIGVSPGDRIALFMPNCIEYLEVMYAAWHAGAVVVPINAKLHEQEAAWMIRHSGARLVVTDDAALLQRALGADAPAVVEIGTAEFDALRAGVALAVPASRAPSDVAWIFYTSGTTGRPKGVMITNANIQAMALSYFTDVDSVGADDTHVYAAPMSHGAGLYNFMFVIAGARHVVPASGGFDAPEIASIAGAMGNVCLFAAPTMVRRMVSEFRSTGYDGSGIRTIVYGGGPMYLADIVDAVDGMGPRFVQIYGQGECPMTITALSRHSVCDRSHPRWKERLASVGKAFASTQVRVVDAQDRELPCGEIGEIVVSGAPVMAGYWANSEATAEAIRDGWLWTGDMGAMDEDGYLTLHDRSKDVIISGGTNIYPREVEEVLLSHPAVAQASVVGQPDPEWGESVVAFVVFEPGQDCSDAELDAHCLASIARFKRPKRYIRLNDLPKNAYGKVLKKDLKARMTAIADALPRHG